MAQLHDLAVAHLQLRLQGLHRALEEAVRKQIERSERLSRADLSPLCVTEDEVMHLLGDAERLASNDAPGISPIADADAEGERTLRTRAAAAGLALPLDMLAQHLRLSAFEQFAVLVCTAPALDRCYERIYAFILDELDRRGACEELITILSAASLTERIACRHALSRFGKLRRSGVLMATGNAGELRQELRLAEGLFGYITGDGNDISSLCRDSIAWASAQDKLPAARRIREFAVALSRGELQAVGVWGPHQSGTERVAHALAAELGSGLRRWAVPSDENIPAILASLRAAGQEALAARAALWIAADAFAQPSRQEVGNAVAEELVCSPVNIVMTASKPWRPAELLASVSYAEIELSAPDLSARRDLWLEELPELAGPEATEMATRLRFARQDIRAAVRMAQSEQRVAGDADDVPLFSRVQRATAALSASRCRQFATLIRPKRGPADLILPEALHRQVLEIAQFYRAWPTVAETWGFGRLATGEGGIKALFAGESGTGKTLAAEVIAGELQMPLLRVELSRVVSKWVGETEKNLEAAFAEADDGKAVLLFDEADALFGKRGDVESGVDRYANLEVSYLLQRLDDYAGLTLLASNLKDNIDSAFTRRLQTILYFPRPERPERLRIWRIAFPRDAPLDRTIDFEALASLDLTGAGIVGAARTAALFAAQEGADAIGKSHIVRAIARQFRREARLLTPVELGPYANLLQEAR